MGGQATLCFMDISYDSQKVHWRDPILYDVWIQSSYPYGKWFLTLRSDQFLGSGNEQLLSPDLDLAEERKEVAGIRLAQYLQRLQQGFEKGVEMEGVHSQGPRSGQGGWKHEKSLLGKAWSQLGGTLSGDLDSQNGDLLVRGSRRDYSSSTMECK